MKQSPITRRAFALSSIALTAALGTVCAHAEASVQQLLLLAFVPKDKAQYDAKT